MLTFSNKDRLGVLVLVVLIVLVSALPYLAPTKPTPPLILDDSLQTWIDTSRQVKVAGYQSRGTKDAFDYHPRFSEKESGFEKAALFAFDPNTLDSAGWGRLGLPARNIRTLLNYRKKGGRFRTREDLQKIWGLPEGFYQRVADHIYIKENENGFNKILLKEHEDAKPSAPILNIDINNADASAWEALPGIGPKLAARIINFRNKLGGFVSVEQVGETYGLPDTTFLFIKPKLKLNNSPLTKIKINEAGLDELNAHPYIDWKLAKAIIAYRQQHGIINSKEDLEKLMLLDEPGLKRLLPYLQFR